VTVIIQRPSRDGPGPLDRRRALCGSALPDDTWNFPIKRQASGTPSLRRQAATAHDVGR